MNAAGVRGHVLFLATPEATGNVCRCKKRATLRITFKSNPFLTSRSSLLTSDVLEDAIILIILICIEEA
jgi:hypothetical protein